MPADRILELSQKVNQACERLETNAKLSVWFENNVKMQALYEINKNSELDDDWQWIQDNCFEVKDFYR